MADFFRDLKHSLRMFRQTPGFTIAAVAALSLGIGTNTAIFSVVNSVLLKPAPFPDPERLVLFLNTSPRGSGPGASPAKFLHWRQQDSVVQDVTAYRTGVVNLTGGGLPEQLRSAQVSVNYFRLFGASAIQGRTFTPEEDQPHGDRVVVLSHGFWQRRFGSDPQIIGKSISLGGDPYTVVGIIAPSFDFREMGPPPDVWTPFQLELKHKDKGHYLTAAGRLKPCISLEQAKAKIRDSAQDFRLKNPTTMPKDQGFSVESIREALVSN